tara:strand:- start:104 stop:295 length:192 start_codon:yes stop_codon:yes gene_type:complete
VEEEEVVYTKLEVVDQLVRVVGEMVVLTLETQPQEALILAEVEAELAPLRVRVTRVLLAGQAL